VVLRLFSLKLIKIIPVRELTLKCVIFPASTFIRPDDARNWSRNI